MPLNPNFNFQIEATDGASRSGSVQTAHGTFATPCFMATATAGTVKGMTTDGIRDAGAELVISNTYHLMLRPGAERVEGLGGLHKFMNWPGPILTDSGGYQVMSLSALRKISEKGVLFRSHLDGSPFELDAERSVGIQHALDSDITMCFDECTPHPATEEQAASSMRLSMRWAARCRTAFRPRPGYALFGINQGSLYERLREESAKALVEIGFDGFGIGGLAVGEGQTEMFRMLDATVPFLPVGKPRYLMGVGWPSDIVGAVRRGVDMFDCVIPTRSGRTGQAITRRGTLNIRNQRHQEDPRPVDEQCSCVACKGHSRAYLHHLFRAGEMLGPILLSAHNLFYYQSLMATIRRAVTEVRFERFAVEFAESWATGDIEARG